MMVCVCACSFWQPAFRADFVDGARTWTCPSGSQPLADFVDGVCVCVFLLLELTLSMVCVCVPVPSGSQPLELTLSMVYLHGPVLLAASL